MRFARPTFWFVTLFLLTTPPAHAKGKPFASGPLNYSGVVTVDTDCFITNLGTKPVSIPTVLLLTGDDNTATGAPDTDTCSTAPLAPNATCLFGGGGGTFGGGVALVEGSARDLRGRCNIRDMETGSVLLSSDMR